MSAAAIPAHMRDLPRDPRGLPITYTSLRLPDGSYDFTQADHRVWLRCVAGRLCGLCGKPLDKRQWFIGGPLCMVNRLFFDLAMHEDCARYALVVCPYLAVRSFTKVKKRNIEGGVHETYALVQKELASADARRPVAFGLARTDGYEPVAYQGDQLVRAKRWTRPIEWWFAGQRVDEPQAFRDLAARASAGA